MATVDRSSQSILRNVEDEAHSAGNGSVLRSSCDTCLAGKIKCDKAHPICGRCRAARIRCVYGISRKHGKARVRKQDHGRESHMKEQRGSLIGPTSPKGKKDFSETDNTPDSSRAQELPRYRPTANATDNGDLLGNHPQDTIESAASSHPNILAHITPSESLDLLDGRFDRNLQAESFDLDIFDTAEPDDLSNVGASRDKLFAPPLVLSKESYHGLAGLTTGSMGSSRSDSIGLSQHSCYALAKSTLYDVHYDQRTSHEPSSFGSMGSPVSSTPSPSFSISASSLSFDHVLSKARNAVRNVARIQQCHCSRDPHLALLSASILCKALVWYQMLANLKQPMISIESPSELTWYEPGSSDFAQFPCAIGEFILDPDDRESLARQLLLKELQHLAQVIDQFPKSDEERFAGYSHSEDRHGALHERTSSLYMMLGVWLKTESMRTMKEVKSSQNRGVSSTAS